MGQRWDAATDALAGFSTRPFNVLGNLASILGLAIALLTASGFGAAWIAVLYTCVLSGYLMLRYVRQERWARYAEANVLMERALRKLKETSDRRIFREGSDDEFTDGLQQALAELARAYSVVTGSNCRATLKEVYHESLMTQRGATGSVELTKELMAATWARSEPELSRTARSEAPDKVTENSDFNFVVTNLRPFCENDLPASWKAGDYRNSHWTDEMRTSRKFPYRSAIVWPIEADRPGDRSKEATRDDADGARDPVIAVLCVDSKRTGAFRRAVDVPMGALFAHALYPLLRYEFGE